MSARILIIEDNQANLDLMTYLLNALGHETLTALDGESGLAMARRERPDLIICDMQMPRMDGYAVARELKSDASLCSIPRVAVTAFAMVGDREKVMAAGFNEYLSKPIDPESFVAQIDALLPAGIRSRAPQQAAANDAAPEKPAPRGPLILVVDNTPTNIELAIGILEPHGYRLITAENMHDALALARKHVPALILSDVCMAEGSGFDFLAVVKADPALREIPFVFITSTLITREEEQRGKASGATRYLVRPIEPRELIAEIEACLKG